MTANLIIDALGGTGAVAVLCETSAAAVSQWRKKGIPTSRLMYLRAVRPEVFPADLWDAMEGHLVGGIETTDLPAPFTPADADLRGLPFMPLDAQRLLDSDLFGLSTGAEFKAALALWCKSWSQIPAGSLPSNDRILAGLSCTHGDWKQVRAVALHGWVLCSDGRYYHPVVCEKVMQALPKREAFAAQKASNLVRKFRERGDRKAMFEDLRERGVVPEWDAPTKQLRELLSLHEAAPDDPNGAQPGSPVTPPVTLNVTAKRGRGRGRVTTTTKPSSDAIIGARGIRGPDGGRRDDDSHPAPNPADAPTPPPDPADAPTPAPDPADAPTEHGALALILRALGVRVVVTDPLLIAWADELHITRDEAREAVASARVMKPAPQPIYPAYLNAIIRNGRAPHAARSRSGRTPTATDRNISVIAQLTGRDGEREAATLDGSADRVD